MSTNKTSFFFYLAVAISISACSSKKDVATGPLYNYTPDNQELHNTIVAMDSVFFEAYNKCNLDKQAKIYSDKIEFYHDKGGVMTDKQEILDGTKKYVCGKVTRELVKGSIEVYSIKDFGAVEIGLHKFHNNTEKAGTPSHASKFIIFWQNNNNDWKITKVVSLH